MLMIVLASEFKFEITSLQEVYDGSSGISSLTLQHDITEANASEVKDEITQASIAKITLLADGEKLDEYTQYDTIVSIEKTITNNDRILVIRLRASVPKTQ